MYRDSPKSPSFTQSVEDTRTFLAAMSLQGERWCQHPGQRRPPSLQKKKNILKYHQKAYLYGYVPAGNIPIELSEHSYPFNCES